MRIALPAGWAATLAAYGAAAAWLLVHPPALSSDDALFLSRGLTRFSILDFSPQFPGYPGMIAMGRLLVPLTGEPIRALAFLTTFVALALPPMATAVAWRSGVGRGGALAAFALALAMPLLPDLALSLLSDGAGVLFLLVFLALLPRSRDTAGPAAVRLASPFHFAAPIASSRPRSYERHFFHPMPFLAGMMLGWAAACRPSDAMLLAGAALGAVIAAPRLLPSLLLGGLLVVLPTVAFLVAAEPLYLAEGLRFVEGHALTWGNTAFSTVPPRSSWWTAIECVPGGAVLAVLFLVGPVAAIARGREASPAGMAAACAFFAHSAWILLMQNPDSLRHLAPLVMLGGLLLALLTDGRLDRLAGPAAIACLTVELYSTFAATDPSPTRPPPLAAAAEWLSARPAGTAIATNDGVFLLRQALPNTRIYDTHYPGDAQLGLAAATGPAFRLTGTPLAGRTTRILFPSRFLGEKSLRLYSGWQAIASTTQLSPPVAIAGIRHHPIRQDHWKPRQ